MYLKDEENSKMGKYFYITQNSIDNSWYLFCQIPLAVIKLYVYNKLVI